MSTRHVVDAGNPSVTSVCLLRVEGDGSLAGLGLDSIAVGSGDSLLSAK